MTSVAHEVNFDGIVGPTHNYAGLGVGNLASQIHKGTMSSPKQAALQGLAKMKLLHDLGFKQAVLPPQDRPDVGTLRRVGFGGSDAQVLERASREAPHLLAACASASAMWAANAATVSPSADSADGRVHFTPANLVSQLHRSIETETTGAVLRAIFRDESQFVHHAPLPATPRLGDEGAANHTRLAVAYGDPGVQIFTYGRPRADDEPSPARFPARQTLDASHAIARLHQLDESRTIFIRQNPDAIDAGVFHNDVIALGNRNVLFYHSRAYEPDFSEKLRRVFPEVVEIRVSEDQVPLADAVSSYMFNSQLLTRPDGSMMLLAPAECQEIASTRDYLAQLTSQNSPIRETRFIDVRQSMNNGGGPACLRLRVVLTDKQLTSVQQGVLMSDDLYVRLAGWVGRHYRDTLGPGDLADPKLLEESRQALDELATRILGLGSIYPFQRNGA